MLETPFSFFVSKKPGDIPMFGIFFREKNDLFFFLFNFGIFSLKIRFFK